MIVPIQITEEDIRFGKPAKLDSCPVALAANRAFRLIGRRPFIHPTVGFTAHQKSTAILIVDVAGGLRHRFLLGSEVSERIREYDAAGAMQPFSFSVNLEE